MVEIELIKKEVYAKDINLFYFKPKEKVNFKPGYHAIFEMEVNGEAMKRPFTFYSLPSEDILQFIIKKEGKFTSKLFEMEEGSRLSLGNVFGKYSFSDDFIGKKLVCVAGGTGIIPFLCMKKYVDAHNLDVEFKILLSVKSTSYIFGEADVITLTDEPEKGYLNGRIDKDFLMEHISKNELAESPIFVCGPYIFEKEIKATLLRLGANNII